MLVFTATEVRNKISQHIKPQELKFNMLKQKRTHKLLSITTKIEISSQLLEEDVI